MKRFCSLVLGSLLAVGQAGAATAAGPDAAPGAAPEKQFAASLQTLSRALTIPGVAFAVIRDGEVVSLGQVNANPDAAALTLDTPLRFASVTKALTAVALMRAVDRGALSLDGSAAQWLPEFADRPQITVRQLAVTSGNAPSILGQMLFGSGNERYLRSLGYVRPVKGAATHSVVAGSLLLTAGLLWVAAPVLDAFGATHHLISAADVPAV